MSNFRYLKAQNNSELVDSELFSCSYAIPIVVVLKGCTLASAVVVAALVPRIAMVVAFHIDFDYWMSWMSRGRGVRQAKGASYSGWKPR